MASRSTETAPPAWRETSLAELVFRRHGPGGRRCPPANTEGDGVVRELAEMGQLVRYRTESKQRCLVWVIDTMRFRAPGRNPPAKWRFSLPLLSGCGYTIREIQIRE